MKKTKKPLTNLEIETKRSKEKEIAEIMIKMYCHRKHKTKGKDLCLTCQELLDYSNMRTDKCPLMATKTFCAFCKIKCYKKSMHEQMVEVMKFSGPRMLWSHPHIALRHMVLLIKEKRKIKKQSKGNKDNYG